MVALPVNYFNHGPINSDHVIDKITQHVKVQVLSTNEWLHTDRWLSMRRNMQQQLGRRASSGNAVSALDARPRRKLSPGFRDKLPARTPGRGAGTLQLARSSTRPGSSTPHVRSSRGGGRMRERRETITVLRYKSKPS